MKNVNILRVRIRLTVKENADAIDELRRDYVETVSGMPSHEDLKSIGRIVELNTVALTKLPSHEDLNQISKYVEESIEVINKKLDKVKAIREELVQFKRDCGQDVLQLKRKINYLDSIQRPDDRDWETYFEI